jgi:hypothetical protein
MCLFFEFMQVITNDQEKKGNEASNFMIFHVNNLLL